MSFFRDSHIFQLGAFFSGEELPGHNVAVMFHLGQHYAITETDVWPAPGVRDQIDRFSSSPYEDYLCWVFRIDQFRDSLASVFVCGCSFFADLVDPAEHVRVVFVIVPVQGLNDLNWFLGCCGVVEIDERFSVHLAAEDWEIWPYTFYVISGLCSG